MRTYVARNRHSRSILQSAPSRLPSRLVALGSRGSRHAARLLYERALATFEKGARIRTSSIAESIENLASFFRLKGISPEPLLDTSASCRGSKRCRRGAATLRAYAGGRRARPSFVARCAVTSCACLSAQPAASRRSGGGLARVAFPHRRRSGHASIIDRVGSSACRDDVRARSGQRWRQTLKRAAARCSPRCCGFRFPGWLALAGCVCRAARRYPDSPLCCRAIVIAGPSRPRVSSARSAPSSSKR